MRSLFAGTVLRIVCCGLLFWFFTAGSYQFPVTLQSAVALVTLLSLLLSYELAIRDMRLEYAFGGMILAIVGILGGYGIWLLLRPPEPTGPLLPAGEPSPVTACRQKTGPGDLAMVFGTNRVIGKGDGPFMPFSVDSCPGISLRRRGNGLVVDAAAYDWNNDVAFLVRDNVYEPMDVLQLRPVRPDRSSFALLDRFDQEVLYIRYVNRNTVRIRARLLCGEAPQAVIRDTAIFVGGVRIGGAYFGLRRAAGNRCVTVNSREPGVAIGDPRPQ